VGSGVGSTVVSGSVCGWEAGATSPDPEPCPTNTIPVIRA
jgi:hypothetical protein